MVSMFRKIILFSACFFMLSGCEEEKDVDENTVNENCKGLYSYRDEDGNLKKKNEYFHESLGHCVTESVALTNYEEGLEKRRRLEVTCEPQSGFPAVSMRAANNFYQYRDSRVFLNFQSSGEFRKIIHGEDEDGNPTFSRTLGCFWQRTGTGVDVAFGNQLYLDGPQAASSDLAHRNEIFQYTIAGNDVSMTRYDNSGDWDYRFCPYLNVPWEYCEELRNGNIMFWPDLPAGTQTDLRNEALLIRKEFNYVLISDQEFENLWENIESSGEELSQQDWKYDVVHLPDEPPYTWEAWKDYVVGDRPTMPDVASSQLPPLCYPGRKEVTLSDGATSHIYGEVCYEDGEYTFTED